MKRLFFLCIFSLVIMLFPSIVDAASCPPPYASIESISSHNACLQITDATKFCGGRIAIFNNCTQTYYVNGKAILPRMAAFPYLNQKNWTVTIKDSNNKETINVKGTSTKENYNLKPYAARITPTPSVTVSAFASVLSHKYIYLFAIFIIIGSTFFVFAVFRKKQPHPLKK